MSVSCVPSSTILPLSTTAILSALRIVDRRCAMTMVVRLCVTRRLSSAACTMRSLSVSSALVASSSSNTDGFLIMARAIAMRCFCPPDSCPPFSPTSVSKLAGNSWMNPKAFDILAAATTSSLEAPGLPLAMFSEMVPAKRTGSCPTSPICCRSQRTLSFFRSTPSSVTEPESGS
mmetsp:Transcript_84427/g.123505  ORF Transcript_84427/g.123505 Transcript_84427/m.123505 type:complete len:175 (-) Transcript_84427:654-1178(-)